MVEDAEQTETALHGARPVQPRFAVLGSPALVFAFAAIVAFAFVVVSSLSIAYGNFVAGAEARTARAVDVLAADIENSLKNAEDVLQYVSRSIEIYGPGLVSEDLDPRMSLTSTNRAYLGLSVWSSFGDLLVTTDPRHAQFDMGPLLTQLTTAQDRSLGAVPFMIATAPDATEQANGTTHILLTRGLYESEEFVGVSVIELSLAHLEREVSTVAAETAVPMQLLYDSSIILGRTNSADDTSETVAFTRSLPFGFAAEAIYRPATVRAEALHAMRWLFVLSVLFGSALVAFAILLYHREINLRRVTTEAQKRSESERRAREEAETLLAGIQLLAAKDSEEELYAGILSVIANVVPLEDAAILIESEADQVIFAASLSEARRGAEFARCGFVQRILSGEAFVVPSFETLGQSFALPDGMPRAGSAIFTPLRAGQRHACIMCLHREENGFANRHLASLNRFAPLAAQVVKRAEEIAQLRRSVDRLDHVAHHDGLTGLANRKRFVETLSDCLFRHHDSNFSLLQLDLDRFKAINDSLGHGAGDFLLTVIGHRLAGSIRPGDFCARLGGDEFAVILNGALDDAEIAALAQRIIEQLQRPVTYEGRTLMPGTSIGISRYPSDGQSAKGLMNAADLALFSAKSEGRGCYAFFGCELRAEVERSHRLENVIRTALAESQLTLHYQPICDLKTGEVRAYEALLRLHDENGSLIAPKEIIAAAERARFMSSITRWIVETALRDLARWLQTGPDRRVAINLSASELVAPDLVPMLNAAIAREGLFPQHLELELNEEITSDRLLQTALVNLNALHGAGYPIAFDDFGTGYSSLKHLRGFSGHRLKLDQSLIREVDRSDDSQALLRSLVDLSSSLNLRTVAEGIETQAQYDMCRSLGCDEGQGYLISKPRPLSDIMPAPGKVAGLRDSA